MGGAGTLRLGNHERLGIEPRLSYLVPEFPMTRVVWSSARVWRAGRISGRSWLRQVRQEPIPQILLMCELTMLRSKIEHYQLNFYLFRTVFSGIASGLQLVHGGIFIYFYFADFYCPTLQSLQIRTTNRASTNRWHPGVPLNYLRPGLSSTGVFRAASRSTVVQRWVPDAKGVDIVLTVDAMAIVCGTRVDRLQKERNYKTNT